MPERRYGLPNNVHSMIVQALTEKARDDKGRAVTLLKAAAEGEEKGASAQELAETRRLAQTFERQAVRFQLIADALEDCELTAIVETEGNTHPIGHALQHEAFKRPL